MPKINISKNFHKHKKPDNLSVPIQKKKIKKQIKSSGQQVSTTVFSMQSSVICV